MGLYRCKIIDEKGHTRKVIRNSEDEVNLRSLLKTEGCILLSSKLIEEKKPNLFFSVSSKVKRSEVVIFLRQFSVLVNSSISISDSLKTLKNQSFSKPLKKVLMEVYDDVISGDSLSDAFLKHPKIFPDFFCQMVAIGEVSGSLSLCLNNMADYYENTQKLKKKTKNALTYPTIIFVMINLVVIFMSFVILPNFEDMFKDFGGDIPNITKVILAIAAFIREYIGVIFLAIVALAFIIFLYFRSGKGKYTKDVLLLRLPLIGKINKASITARFAKAFVILLQSGMPITTCMENLKKVLSNRFFSKKFDYAIIEVRRGRPIAKSIENTGMFPKMLTEMIAVGDKSGNLEGVLASTSSFYDSEVETAVSRATAVLEPIMLIFLGLIVAVVLLSVYLPMIDLMNQI